VASDREEQTACMSITVGLSNERNNTDRQLSRALLGKELEGSFGHLKSLVGYRP
jgi:hypothetical protein